jgi:putative replication protein|nr:MAG TPA: homing endonuclease [Caudoviricetes sp.]
MNSKYIYNPKPIEIYPGYFAVKETGLTPINKKGFYIPRTSDKPTKGSLSGQYYNYHENKNLGLSTAVHRIMALTFLPCPGNPKFYDVNHKDGNKLNNSLDNLEWCTRAENCQHAYQTGLRNDSVVILVKNLTTEEIKEFYSIQATARFFETSGSRILLYLRSERQIPFKQEWVLIRKGEEWPSLTKNDIPLFEYYNTDKPIIVEAIDKSIDEKKYIFACIKHVSFFLKCSEPTAMKALKLTKPLQGYIVLYLDNYKISKEEILNNPKIKLMKEYLSKNKSGGSIRKPSPVRRIDIVTNEEKIYESLWDLAKEYGMKKNSLEKAIWRNKGIFKGYRYEYLDKKIKNKWEK